MPRNAVLESFPILVVALEGEVVGVDAATGATVWKSAMPEGGVVFVAIAGLLVFVSDNGASVRCLDYTSGHTLWEAPTGARGRATILVQGDQVIVAKPGVVDCFTRTGAPVWRRVHDRMARGRVALGFPGNVQQADDNVG